MQHFPYSSTKLSTNSHNVVASHSIRSTQQAGHRLVLEPMEEYVGSCIVIHVWQLTAIARMVLNYKNIDYKTEWVEYPDLEPYFKSLCISPPHLLTSLYSQLFSGIPANDPKAPGYFAPYSSPAVKYPDGTFGMDSWPIAHELEKRFPSPSLHLDDPIVVQVRDSISKLMMPLIGHLLPKVPVVLLNPKSAEYFDRTREVSFGKPLPELEKEKATEQAWKDVEGPAKMFGDLLRKNSGPFFLGETVSYADFIFLGFLQMAKRLNSGLFERVLGLDQAFPKIFKASKKWLEKED